MEKPIDEARLGTMSMSRCTDLRTEVYAYIASSNPVSLTPCRTLLIELMAQIKALDAQAADANLLLTAYRENADLHRAVLAATERRIEATAAAHAGELAGQAQAHRQQVEGLKNELAEQEREKLKLVLELSARL